MINEMPDKWMNLALDLASRGRGFVEPNPMVGAVIVKDNQVIGVGWHQKFGEQHAEVEALHQAGNEARGATLFVSLEPCSHHGKTPPCADAVVKAGISKVFIAMRDPNPLVSGKGIEFLKRNGIVVQVGVEKDKAEILNGPFIKYFLHSKPYVIAKWAMSLDGKIATKSGESKWISNEKCRDKVHQLRGLMDAVLVGVGTVLQDDPMLNARPEGPRKQTRIVIDPSGRIATSSKILKTACDFKTMIALHESVSDKTKKTLESMGCELLELSSIQPSFVINEILLALGKKGIQNLLVEGGGKTLGAFFDSDQVDEIQAFIAPFVIGGESAPAPVGGAGINLMHQRRNLLWVSYENVDDNLHFSGRLKHYSSD